jgi:hypothetical protein
MALLLLFSLTACGGPSQGSGATFHATGLKGDPTIALTVSNDLLLVDVTSPSGIGSARIEKTSGAWPSQIILRLHLMGLESLKFAYADRIVALEVPSSGLGTVYETLYMSQEAPATLTVDSPYWMEVTPGKGYFDVAAPPDFFNSGADQFMLEWIDFYR